MKWLALDIGGANIKIADGRGYSATYPFAMWKSPHTLPQELRMAIATAPHCDRLAVTMTGELADCFESKVAGVNFILDAVIKAADGRHTRVYLTNGSMVTPQAAKLQPLLAAASNWHALATFAGRSITQGAGLLIDIGSTTTDVVPLLNGQAVAKGHTDTTRLLSGEMIYSGVERTPVHALVRRVTYRQQRCPVAAEYFATTGDVYLLLGAVADDPECTNTADGRPATRRFARLRLGRLVCADDGAFNHRDAAIIASEVQLKQVQRLVESINQITAALPEPLAKVFISGKGEFLARRALKELKDQPEFVSLGRQLGRNLSTCASAHALAVVAARSNG